MTGEPRRRGPQAFDADDPAVEVRSAPQPGHEAARPSDGGAPNAMPDATDAAPPTGNAGRRLEGGFRWMSLFISTVLGLATLAAGLWFARFVSIAVGRDDWLGMVAKGAAIVIVVALVAICARELFGFLRLARLSRIRRTAERALATGDVALERDAVASLRKLAAARADMKWSLARFRERERYQTAPGALLAHADVTLLDGADRQARRVVFESARRVAVVTAVVPIAFISVLFVLSENVRMVRRLAAAYGGRPGFIGGVRLLWRVIAYIAASGAVILTDDLFGQFLGQDLVRRLSRRLGEGAFNGALTARLGVAAIELCRPLPFVKATRPRARHMVRELFPEFRLAGLAGRRRGDARPQDRGSVDQ